MLDRLYHHYPAKTNQTTMTTPKKADASDWAWLEGNSTVNRCDAAWSRGLIELRARVEALEAVQAAKDWLPTTALLHGSSPAASTEARPAGLVERVADVFLSKTFTADDPVGARAAIREVAAWLDGQLEIGAAHLLREEAGNG
jgi:hypothetical protein